MTTPKQVTTVRQAADVLNEFKYLGHDCWIVMNYGVSCYPGYWIDAAQGISIARRLLRDASEKGSTAP